MVKHALHEEQYLNVHKFYKQIYDSESIQQDETKWKEVSYIVILEYVQKKEMYQGSTVGLRLVY